MALLAAILRNLRAQKRERQIDTARAIGLSQSTYKRLERGDYLASGYDLQRIGRHFGLDANLLVFGFTLVGDPDVGPRQQVRRMQRLFYRLRALEPIAQDALTQLVVDLYRLQRLAGGTSAEVAAKEAEQRLIDTLNSLTK